MSSLSMLRRLSTGELLSYLSTHGLSQSGIRSIKENGISGEMLMDFCEEDIKDAFSVFKDRFIIRKLIRETNSPRAKYDPYPSPRKTENDARIEQKKTTPQLPFQDRLTGSRLSVNTPTGSSLNARYCAPTSQTNSTLLSQTSTAAFQHVQRHSASNSLPIPSGQSTPRAMPVGYLNRTVVPKQTNQRTSTTMTSPQVVSQPQHANPPSMMGFTSPYPVSIQKVQVCGPPLLCSDIKSESRIRSPTVSSTQEDIQRRQQDQKSQRLSKDSDVQIIDVSGDDSYSSNSDRTDLTHHGPIHLVTLDERSRLKKYTAHQLLEKKSLRGRPNEAQHLGSLAIRNAAQEAKIWEHAPLMRHIDDLRMTKFKECIVTFAPQLATEMDLVLCRLREALQNRRKYLLDRETGKRALAMKKARSNSTQSQIDVKSVLQINHFMPHSPKKEVKEEKTDFVIEIQ